MSKRKKADSKEIGLDLGIILSKYFFKTDHLHYGYWTSDLEVDISNLAKAQENYANFLVSNIPKNVKNVLDVGCGIGKLAYKLTTLGYKVDGVSPSKLLTKYARELLGDKSRIFECKYEYLQTENKYDLIMFSESFQYVDIEKALENNIKLLNEGGYLIISDFFKTDAKGDSPLGGGHHLSKFYETIARYPFKLVKDIDITNETAPNLKLVDDFLTTVGIPVWESVMNYLDIKFPKLSKIVKWKFRKKLDKITRKYFNRTRNAENFKIFKSYRFMLYQK
ncbi:MAG: class I SAM-dependent methyltransferase [Elusimicrobia bacterium]|nr:class I SAM-dependent methyltransferase [Elusimicrobiota bacterium]MBU2614454.1 class I SAM-dependent methyltransferase [Elusimicrobiota bacterium]